MSSSPDSVPEALDLAATIDAEIFVQGGAQIYAEALPVADLLELTWVDADPAGDTLFPEVDWSQWVETAREYRSPGGAWVDVRPPVGPDRTARKL